MPVINNNKYMLDRPMWEQLSFAPATGVAGSCNCDDNRRFIYNYFQTSTTAAQFWRYDTWADCWQQLTTPATQTGSVGSIRYVESFGGQFGGTTYGSVWLLIWNGTVAYFYKYDIATNAWSARSITNLPASLGSDFSLVYPEPQLNNNIGGYNSFVRTITTSATVATGATTISVSALPQALEAGTRLRFGKFDITLSAEALAGATTLSVVALPYGVNAGTLIETPRGGLVTVRTTANAGATSIDVYPIRRWLPNGSVFNCERYVVLTATAAANATSITVAACSFNLESGAIAYYYDHMYIVASTATVMYRYQVSTNTWATTNAAGAAMPSMTSMMVGGGCSIKWLPSYDADKLYIIRGNNTANIYTYSLGANTFATQTFQPNTETFTTASTHTVRSIGGKGYSIISSKDATMRIYEYDPSLSRLHPKMNQWLYPTGAAVQGDRATCLRSPDEVEFYYLLLPASTAFVRCALIDS